jgi:putative nucleotidyltransferase with HDIG domain
MTSLDPKIRDRVQRIETTPTIPTVLLPLLDLLKSPPEKVAVSEVIKLVSYDSAIAAHCMRMAASPLFGLAKPPKSINAAVMTLGTRRVETILLTCCLGQAFPTKNWPLDPVAYWRHSLGCALVCRKFSEKLSHADRDRAYTAGLLHDLGLMVNCMVFPQEFANAMRHAGREQIAFDQAEHATMGFTHCETGRALAEQWMLGDDLIQVIAHHHDTEQTESSHGLVALVHLSDLLCRLRNLGYGYYERNKADLVFDPAWAMLLKEHKELDGVDLVRFTFELDESLEEIHQLVASIFGTAAAIGA